MKHFPILLTSLLLAVCAACSHNQARERLAAEVAAVQTPVSLGASGSLTSVTYNQADNSVTFDYVLSHYIDAGAFDGATEHQKRVMASFLQGEQGRAFLDMLDKAEAALALRFTIGDNEPRTVALTPAEIHELAGETGVIDNSVRQLHDIAALENSRCPADLGHGLTADSVTIEEKYLTFIATGNDTLSIATSAQKAALRSQLLQDLESSAADTRTATILDLLRKARFGVRHRVTIATDSTEYILDITPEEIARIGGTDE